MSKAPFPIDPHLTAIAIGYTNAALIADQVLPRLPVGKAEFKYWSFPVAEAFTVPDTLIGRRSKPNEVEFSAVEATASTEDYGLDDVVPQSDIDNAPPNYSPLDRATMGVTDLVLLDREIRVANKVFNAASYPAANKTTLSGTSQWSHADSNPISAILTGMDAALTRPNVLLFGQGAWTIFRQNPKIVSACLGNSGDKGIATRQQVAELFEVEEVIVGAARVNTARKGQAASFTRTWGKHCLAFHRDQLASAASPRPTFGATFQFGTRVSGSTPEPNVGLRGGQRVRAGESVKELLLATQAAFFWENAVG
ncbi:MAG: phage capsid protein [Dechloromonas sp.]|nr:MAG: phage capsid protein [Dechloromonas sp.]